MKKLRMIVNNHRMMKGELDVRAFAPIVYGGLKRAKCRNSARNSWRMTFSIFTTNLLLKKSIYNYTLFIIVTLNIIIYFLYFMLSFHTFILCNCYFFFIFFYLIILCL